MTDKLTPADVAYVAALARLEVSPEEMTVFAEQLSSVLEHVESIRRLDLTGVVATSHPLALQNVLRADVVQPCLDHDEALAAAPEIEEGRFKVPSILGEAP